VVVSCIYCSFCSRNGHCFVACFVQYTKKDHELVKVCSIAATLLLSSLLTSDKLFANYDSLLVNCSTLSLRDSLFIYSLDATFVILRRTVRRKIATISLQTVLSVFSLQATCLNRLRDRDRITENGIKSSIIRIL
jgi:hypothetical protein